MLDYAMIMPRLQRLYEWSVQELGEPRSSSSFATALGSMRGLMRSDTSGALRTCT